MTTCATIIGTNGAAVNSHSYADRELAIEKALEQARHREAHGCGCQVVELREYDPERREYVPKHVGSFLNADGESVGWHVYVSAKSEAPVCGCGERLTLRSIRPDGGATYIRRCDCDNE